MTESAGKLRHVKTSFTEAAPKLAPLNTSQDVNKDEDINSSEAAALMETINISSMPLKYLRPRTYMTLKLSQFLFRCLAETLLHEVQPLELLIFKSVFA